MFRRVCFFVLGVSVIALIFAHAVFAAEIELSTYYPAPDGEYKDLKASGSMQIPVKHVEDASEVEPGEIWFESTATS